MFICGVLCLVFISALSRLFFKEKTAYGMRISDWSSDVCSSDLIFSHGHVLEKRIMLKNEADVPIGDLEIRHVFAIEGHLAGIRKFKSGNDAEQGRFT